MEELQLLVDVGPNAIAGVAAIMVAKLGIHATWAFLIWKLFSGFFNATDKDEVKNEPDSE